MKKIGDLIIQNPKSKIKIRDVEKGEFIFFRSGKNTLSHNKKIIDGENIFLSTGGTANVHYFSGDAAYSTDVFCITTDPSVCNTRYLYYKILSMIEVINNDMFKGATIKHLQKDEFKNIEFNIQPLNEQKRIVEKLDTCMEQIKKAIQNMEQNIQNAEDLFQSYLNELLKPKNSEWNTKKLEVLLDIQNGYAFPSKFFSSDTGIPLIRIRDISNVYKTKINFDGEYDDKYIVKKGDFLIGMDGEFKCYEWKGKNSLLNQRVCRLQNFSELLHPKIIYYGINKHLKAIEDETEYTTVKHISSTKIKNIEFSFPPINEQKRIIEKLDTCIDEKYNLIEIIMIVFLLLKNSKNLS